MYDFMAVPHLLFSNFGRFFLSRFLPRLSLLHARIPTMPCMFSAIVQYPIFHVIPHRIFWAYELPHRREIVPGAFLGKAHFQILEILQ